MKYRNRSRLDGKINQIPHVKYHKKRLFEEEKTFSSNRKTIVFFPMNDSF